VLAAAFPASPSRTLLVIRKVATACVATLAGDFALLLSVHGCKAALFVAILSSVGHNCHPFTVADISRTCLNKVSSSYRSIFSNEAKQSRCIAEAKLCILLFRIWIAVERMKGYIKSVRRAAAEAVQLYRASSPA